LAVGVLLLVFELLIIELPAAFSAALLISGGSMDGLRQDLAYAIRVLIKSWGVTLIAVATLALGIGANTAIFSVVNSVLLRPLPFQSADRLLYILEKLPGFSTSIPMNAPDFNAFSERQKSFEQLGIYSNKHFDLSGAGAPERIKGTRVSAAVFPLLGVVPLMGRTYTQEEDKSGHPVVVLSYGLWQRKYGADYSILGRAIQLDRQPYTVIGVMPKSFEFPLRGETWVDGAADLWVPISFTAEERQGWGNMYNHSVIARLKPGVVRAALATRAPSLRERSPRTGSRCWRGWCRGIRW
jgi:putative ABC transport system permease protein